MARRWLGFVVVFLVALITPRLVRADQPGAHTVAVAVLALDSEDAETQADALTGALRSRIRSAPGWSLVDASQTLGMLTAALRCPSRPPPECQQKIAETVKVDRYIWGLVSKGPTQGQVTAEIHFYQKGKPDTVVRESYADNLSDPNDDKGIGKVAAHIVEKLGGSAMGVVVVHAGDAGGEVVVDGDKHVPLQAGQARIELGAGGHAIEVTSTGGAPIKRNILVTAGKETVVEMAEPTSGAPKPEEPSSPFPTRKVIAGGLVVAGVVLGVVAIVELGAYNKAVDAGDKDKATVPGDVKDAQGNVIKPAQKPCDDSVQYPQFCQDDKDAKKASTVGIITAVAGAAAIGGGIVLWLTDSSSSEKPTTGKRKTRLVPTAGIGSGGLLLSGSF
ncbi:MAG TPA: hypothetical protein VIF62_36345 [Labilithrix sp.]